MTAIYVRNWSQYDLKNFFFILLFSKDALNGEKFGNTL